MIVQLQEELKVRAPQMRDIPAIADLVNAASLAVDGVPEVDAQRMRAQWQQPDWDHTTDAWIVQTATGQFVGYGGVRVRVPYKQLFAWGAVHPDFQGQGIGALLVRRSEARTREIMARANVQVSPLVERLVFESDSAAAALLTAQGYEARRRYWEMAITFDKAPSAVVLPDGITLHTLRADNARAVFDAIEEAFQDHWGHVFLSAEEQHAAFKRWYNRTSSDPLVDPVLVFVAMAGDEVAGVALNRINSEAYPDMGHLSTLAVRRPWRQQGLGLALLRQTFGAFYRRGYAGVSLGVDASNPTGAVRLYERAGMHVTREYDIYGKAL